MTIITLKKGESVKFIDAESKLVSALKADGWAEQSTPEEKPAKKVKKAKEKAE